MRYLLFKMRNTILVGALFALLIVGLVIGISSWRIAQANPVQSLKNE